MTSQTAVYKRDEVAEILRIDPQTVLRWAKAGRIGSFRAGREYRFTEAHLQAFIAASETLAAAADVAHEPKPARNPRYANR